MDELKSMRAFVRVVDAGSFTEAARQLGVAKSLVTTRVNQLEEELRTQLIQRSTRRLSLTDTGAVLYDRCVRLLAEVEEAKSAVNSMDVNLAGTLRVSCISSITQSFLANEICEFQLAHPDLKFEFYQHDRFCDPVSEGYDISLQPRRPPPGLMDIVDIMPIRRMVVGTPAYFEKYGRPTKPEDFQRHRFVHAIHAKPTFSVEFITPDGVVSAGYDPVFVTNTITLLRAAVRHGDFLALMPAHSMEKEIISGEFVPILTEFEAEGISLSAYFPRSPFVPMKLRLFLQYLDERYGAVPPWETRILAARPELAVALGQKGRQPRPPR